MSATEFPRSATRNVAVLAIAMLTGIFVVACGGSDSVTKTPTYSIGGTVSGLVGTGLVLQDNGSGNLAVSASGPFTFATSLTNGSSYAVTVSTQPTSPAQTCVVTSGSGTVTGANVSSVAVACSTNGYTIGGTVSGLVGTGLVLQDNGGNDLPVSAAGAFTFSNTVGSSLPYAVTVKTQPINPIQSCTVANGTGTVVAANISNVAVTCTTGNFTISGTVSGLVGTGMVVTTNGATPVGIPASGPYTFATLPSGTAYTIAVGTQPSSPTQTCSVTAGATGTVTTANITGVTIACVTNTYAVGGTVSGLTGSGLTLENGAGGASIPISTNGAGETYVTLPSGSTYNIMVKTQPHTPSQTCVVSNPTGPVVNAAVTNVNVACTTNLYTVSGTITGYSGTGTALVLSDNGTDTFPAAGTVPAYVVGGTATFTFPTKLINGAAYVVTVQTQPQTPAQYCTVANGTGSITAANVTNVVVSCRNEGQFAFVADGGAATVNSFTIASNTGALGFVDTASMPAGSNPDGIAVEVLPGVAGTYVYTADFGSADIGMFSVTNVPAPGTVTYLGSAASTGTVPVAAFTMGGGSTPTSITVDPSGLFLLVADSGNGFNGSDGNGNGDGHVLVYKIDQLMGTLTAASGSPFDTTAVEPGNATSFVVVDPTDLYAFATNQFVPSLAGFNFNAPVNSGNLTQLTPWEVPTGANPVWITVDPVPLQASVYAVYVANNTDGTISGWTFTGGVLTAIPGSPFPIAAGGTPGAIATDPTGRFLYVSDGANSQVDAFTINATTGVLTTMTGSPFATTAGGGAFALAIDNSGHFLYVGNSFLGTVSMFTADPVTGNLTPVGAGTVGYAGSVGVNAIAIE
jgi:6-phosphogluconolactonase (cycloisomerase 2 family)